MDQRDPKLILYRARNIQQRIDRRMTELNRLRAMETYLSATDYSSPVVKRSAGRGNVERIATSSKLASLEQRIQRDIDELGDAKLEAISLISLVDDTRMTEILWEYYIRAVRSWDDVASAVGYSRQHVTKLHGKAL